MAPAGAGISNHLACLRGCGLVNPTREGRQVRYELTDPRLAHALRQLTQVVVTSDACPAGRCRCDASR